MKSMKRYLPVVFGILLLPIFLMKINIHDTIAMLRQTDLLPLFWALLLFVLMVYLKGIRWSYLLKMQGVSYSVWNCFLIYMGTLYLGNITPGRVGDFAKIFYLKEDLNISMGRGMTSVLVDRVFDLYLLLILGCVGILTYPMPVDPALIKTVWVFFGLLVFITLLFFNKTIGGTALKMAFQRMMKMEHREKTDVMFKDFHDGMEAFYKPSILFPIFLTLVSYIIFFCACYLIAVAIHLPISILYLSFVNSVVNVVSLLTFMGFGTREGALIVLFNLVSLSKEQAIAYDFPLVFTGTILFSVLAFFCFLLKPIQLKDLSGKKSDARPRRGHKRPRKKR